MPLEVKVLIGIIGYFVMGYMTCVVAKRVFDKTTFTNGDALLCMLLWPMVWIVVPLFLLFTDDREAKWVR